MTNIQTKLLKHNYWTHMALQESKKFFSSISKSFNPLIPSKTVTSNLTFTEDITGVAMSNYYQGQVCWLLNVIYGIIASSTFIVEMQLTYLFVETVQFKKHNKT